MLDQTSNSSQITELTFFNILIEFKKLRKIIGATTFLFFILSLVYISLKKNIWTSQMVIQEATDEQIADLILMNRHIRNINPNFVLLNREILMMEFAKFIEKQHRSELKIRKERNQSYEFQARTESPELSFRLVNSELKPLQDQFLLNYLNQVFLELLPLMKDSDYTAHERIRYQRKLNLKYFGSILIRMQFFELNQKILSGIFHDDFTYADSLNIPIMLQKSFVESKIAFFSSNDFNLQMSKSIHDSIDYLNLMKNQTISEQFYRVSEVAKMPKVPLGPQAWCIILLSTFLGFFIACLMCFVLIFNSEKVVSKQ